LVDVLGNFADGVELVVVSVVVEVVGLAETGLVGTELVEVGLPEVELEGGEVVPPLLRYAGGGTTVDGSLRLPIPQGIASPVPGCVGLGGGVVWPELEAIANRPVHCLLTALGEVNW